MSELVMTVDNEEGANVPSSSPKKMKNSTNTRKQKRLIFYTNFAKAHPNPSIRYMADFR